MPPQSHVILMKFIQENVLVSASGDVQVSDYGLSPISWNPKFTPLSTLGVSGSPQWLAPEIIRPRNTTSPESLTGSKSADVFAFGMLAAELFGGKLPPTTGLVTKQIITGERPSRPQAAEHLGLTGEIWKLIERCWNAGPDQRPSIDEVVCIWETFVHGYVVLSLGWSRIQHPTFSGAGHISAPMVRGRRSRFTEPHAICSEKNGEES